MLHSVLVEDRQIHLSRRHRHPRRHPHRIIILHRHHLVAIKHAHNLILSLVAARVTIQTLAIALCTHHNVVTMMIICTYVLAIALAGRLEVVLALQLKLLLMLVVLAVAAEMVVDKTEVPEAEQALVLEVVHHQLIVMAMIAPPMLMLQDKVQDQVADREVETMEVDQVQALGQVVVQHQHQLQQHQSFLHQLAHVPTTKLMLDGK